MASKARDEENVPMGVQELFGEQLPVSLKGYDREATDGLLSRLQAEFRKAQGLHIDALARIEELEHRIADGEDRERAVTEALVIASQVRKESERDGEEIKGKYLREGEEVKAKAKERADEIVKAAGAEAEEIVEEARSKARQIEQRFRETDKLAEQVHTHLTTFLQSMLADVERRSADSLPVVSDLIARAGEAAAKAGRQEAAEENEAEGTPAEGNPAEGAMGKKPSGLGSFVWRGANR